MALECTYIVACAGKPIIYVDTFDEYFGTVSRVVQIEVYWKRSQELRGTLRRDAATAETALVDASVSTLGIRSSTS